MTHFESILTCQRQKFDTWTAYLVCVKNGGMSSLPPWILYIFAGLIGACVGSFLNVCIQRLPYGESVVWPPSHCRRCGRKLKWWENIPLISYIALRGRCRSCKGRISPQYFIVELISTLLSIACWAHFQEVKFYLAYYLLLIAPLIIITFIDLEHRIIPNAISLPGIAAGFGVHMLMAGNPLYLDAAIDSAIGAAAGGGFLFLVALAYEKLKKCEGLGGGDVKLAAMLGAFFGWRAIIFILLISSLLGSVVGLIWILVTKRNLKFAIPFGPFLAVGGLIYLFFGTSLIRWYLNLISLFIRN